MPSNYQEYLFDSAEDTSTVEYLFPQLLKMLGKPSGPVLDLGCGNGAIVRRLLSLGFDAYGLDASVSGIANANAVAPGRFHVMDVARLELPEALARINFTNVISTEVIEHLYEPRGLLRLARRALPNGGVFIISTPYHGYLKNLALALTGKLDSHFTALWDGGHIKFFSRATLERMLLEEGFRVNLFAGAGRLPLFWKSMLIQATLVDGALIK